MIAGGVAVSFRTKDGARFDPVLCPEGRRDLVG